MGTKEKISTISNGEGRIRALLARMTCLESSLAKTDQRTGKLAFKLTRLASAGDTVGALEANLDAIRAELNGMAQRLGGVEAAQFQDRGPEGVEERIDKLEQLGPGLSALGGDLAQYRLEQSSLASNIEGLKERDGQRTQSLRYATERLETLSKRDAQLEKALSAAHDHLQELGARLDTTATSLDTAQKETIARLASEIEDLRESNRQREQEIQDTSDWIERASERDEQLEKALGATKGRLYEVETVLTTTGASLDAMREENSTREEKITRLVAEEIEGLRELDRQREQEIQDTSGWIERASERDEQLEKALSTTQDRLDDLEAALNTTGTRLDAVQKESAAREERVAALLFETESLRASDGQREQQFQDTSGWIESASERGKQLEKALSTTQDRLDNLEAALNTTWAHLDTAQQENSTREEKVTSVQSGVRVLAWSGAAALVALTAGSLMFVNKQQTDREAIEKELNTVAQSLSGATDEHTEQAQILAQEVTDLQVQIRTLSTRFDALPQEDGETGKQALVNRMAGYDQRQSRLADRLNLLEQRWGDIAEEDSDPDATLAGHMAAYDQDQPRIMENLDELGKRLAQVESQTEPSVDISTPAAEEPLIPPASEPKPREDRQKEKTNPWKTAREQRRYTLQLLGVRNRSSLLEFARRHRLLGDSASLETEHQGKPWFVLFHGIYETQSQAAKAVRELSPTLSRAKPWVRRLPRGGNIEALAPTP